jgi:hypothetical protein
MDYGSGRISRRRLLLLTSGYRRHVRWLRAEVMLSGRKSMIIKSRNRKPWWLSQWLQSRTKRAGAATEAATGQSINQSMAPEEPWEAHETKFERGHEF